MTAARRPGFTLLEILVVMAVISMVMAMSISLIVGVLRTHDADANLGTRLTAQALLADQFRGDVATAQAAPGRAGKFTASSRCLILRQPTGDLIVYRFAPAGLERIEVHGDDEDSRMMTLGYQRGTVEFAREDRVLTLRCVEWRGAEEEPVRHAVEFSAALGGDLQ
jgi:prepilin-type N-terminal cleavage/methylation domain-containing protein